jgi:hypothetical protein
MDELPQEDESDVTSKTLTENIQGLMLKDRDLVDKSQAAFVSFVRYYKEHSLQFIFV